MRRFLVYCAVGLVAAWGLGWLLLMNDDDELPNDADAVVVLEGSSQSLSTGNALVGGGIAPTLVVSTSRDTRDKRRKALCAKPRDDVLCVVVLDGSGESLPTGQAIVGGGIAPTLVVSTSRNTTDKRRKALCAKPRDDVLCVVSGPFTTGGELQAIAKVARNKAWDTVVVVAPSYLSVRLDRVFERCADDARVVQVDVEEPWWREAISLPLEWVNLAVAETVRRGC